MTDTLPRMFLTQAKNRQTSTALRHKREGRYQDVAWETLEQQVRGFGRGLLALGLLPRDRVAILAPNSPEWVYADLGTMAAGGVSVPVYHTEGLAAIRHIVEDGGCRFLFVHSPLTAAELASHRGEMPHLEKLILLEGQCEHQAVLPLEAFLALGAQVEPGQLEERLAAGQTVDLASLVYTSGTTGPPKGVMLTHANFLSNVEACRDLFDIGPSDSCLSFLPLSHVFERMAGYYLMLYQGAVIAYAESFDTIPVNLAEVQPTIAISVPRLYEKMYARIMERVLSGPWLKKQLFFGGLKAARAQLKAHQAGESPPWWLQAAAKLARRVVFAKLNDHLGGRLRFFVSGGAPLNREIAEFFWAAGLPIYEGYGLTETSPVIAVNTPQATRFGTVGRLIPGVEVRIAEDGEIETRGPGLFGGYWNRPEATAEVFNGPWFKTGDIGTLDPDGFLTITDRKKDLIVTAGGENIAPQHLENILKTDKYLANAMVYGDRRPYLTALLVPNLENLQAFARQKQLDFLNDCDLISRPEVLELIRKRIDQLQEGLPSFQRIKRFTLLSRDFGREEITPTMKIRRKQITRHFKDLLEGMYLPKDHGIHDSAFCVVEELNEAERD